MCFCSKLCRCKIAHCLHSQHTYYVYYYFCAATFEDLLKSPSTLLGISCSEGAYTCVPLPEEYTKRVPHAKLLSWQTLFNSLHIPTNCNEPYTALCMQCFSLCQCRIQLKEGTWAISHSIPDYTSSTQST